MTDPTQAVDADERQDDPIFALVGFGATIVAVMILGGLGAGWVDKVARVRVAAATEAIPDLLASWPAATADGADLTFIALTAPLLLLTLSFRRRWSGDAGLPLPYLSPRYRWPALGVAAALVAGALTLDTLNAGRDLGVATLSGVTWLHDGETQSQARWADARRVEITCWDGFLTYDVVFADDAHIAPLGRGAKDDIGGWIDRLTLVDQTLRAYDVERVREGEEACLRRYDEGLIPSERERFRAVVAG